jgi:hypothetical protein
MLWVVRHPQRFPEGRGAAMLRRLKLDFDALFVIAVAVFVGGCVMWALATWIRVIA